jgi:hypothetical protein
MENEGVAGKKRNEKRNIEKNGRDLEEKTTQ